MSFKLPTLKEIKKDYDEQLKKDLQESIKIGLDQSFRRDGRTVAASAALGMGYGTTTGRWSSNSNLHVQELHAFRHQFHAVTNPVCQCGKDKHGFGGKHSDWCDKGKISITGDGL